MTTRRDFLKCLGLLAVGAAFPSRVLANIIESEEDEAIGSSYHDKPIFGMMGPWTGCDVSVREQDKCAWEYYDAEADEWGLLEPGPLDMDDVIRQAAAAMEEHVGVVILDLTNKTSG